MSSAVPVTSLAVEPAKFQDPARTATGEARAHVALDGLATLWFNTGTLCNLTCQDCYIESSPTNDRLTYLSLEEVRDYLDQIDPTRDGTQEIGFTGGEPFMNPDLVPMIALSLERGFKVLVLTNAMRPMMKVADRLLPLAAQYGDRLTVRVSLDHYGQALHETERGARSWQPAIEGLQWLVRHGFAVNVAGRLKWGEPEAAMRAGYGRLFDDIGVALDSDNPVELVLFPEMDEAAEVPEITEACWGILGVSPHAMMCASSRMIVKRKDAEKPVVVPCTLLPYDERFEMGETLEDARQSVSLNHPHCAKFCVLGGGACSVG